MQENLALLLTWTTFREFRLTKIFQVLYIVQDCAVRIDCGIEFTMEHYRKKRIRFYEAEALPNEIKVTNSGRTQEIAAKAARKLKVCKFLINGVYIKLYPMQFTLGGGPRWNSNIQ